MRAFPFVCVLIAGASIARAQQSPEPPPVDPPAPDPSKSPEPSPSPSPAPSATVSPPLPAAKNLRAKLPPSREARAQAEQRCAARDPSCDWIAALGSLERQSVLRVLAARGLVPEPAPWGKRIGRVHIFNEDVFAEPNRVLQFFNLFHVTTKERAIEHEIVIGAGEVWDQDRVDETARRLRDPLYSSVVAVIPVQSATPGMVDMLVVTRDVWSLRLNTLYTYQQGKLTNLSFSLSENNFWGTRSVVAAAVTMDQGSIQAGPLFIDKNLFGKHIDFRARINTIVARDDLLDRGELTSEGSSSTITLAKSLWSLASEWGAGLSFSHRFAIDRSYSGLSLRTYDNPDTPEEEAVPYIYRMRRWNVDGYAVRQFGDRVKHQVTIGHTVDSVRPRPLDTFPGDATQRAAFVRDVLPRSELMSTPYVSYALFTPRYLKLRNVATYDLAEEARLGPDLSVSVGFGLEVLGSDDNFQRGSISTGWTFPWCRDGTIRFATGASVRAQDGELIDNTASVGARVVTPMIGFARLVADSSLGTRWNDTSNRFYTIGSDNGLRGFAINEFSGQRLLAAQFELRTLPYSLWVLRIGAVAFYELGGAADTLRSLRIHQDVGFGFRILMPWSSRELFRFDFAFPIDGLERGRPHFIAGFDSAF
ncbi:MAG: hypothetical protein AB7O24_33705 [Kofleriaceae bacterium]